jgi:hypothetical protein
VTGAHQLLREVAQHLRVIAVSAAGHVVDDPHRVVCPPHRQVTVGQGLRPRGGVEEERLGVVLVLLGQSQVLLQNRDQPSMVTAGLVGPLHEVLDLRLQH